MNDHLTEAEEIARGLAENDETPWEWGVYVERNDGGEWTPLVYGGCVSREEAIAFMFPALPALYRRPRLVRRAVSPWDVVDHE